MTIDAASRYSERDATIGSLSLRDLDDGTGTPGRTLASPAGSEPDARSRSTADPVRDGLVGALPQLWRFALRLARHRADAEDLVQRTCVRALEQRHRYDERGRLSSWLFRLCHNLWRNELRASSVQRSRGFGASGAGAAGSGPGAASLVASVGDTGSVEAAHTRTPERDAFLQEVIAAVEALPDAQRDVVLLVSVEGFGYREAAEILEIPMGTVLSRLARARLALGRRFARHPHTTGADA